MKGLRLARPAGAIAVAVALGLGLAGCSDDDAKPGSAATGKSSETADPASPGDLAKAANSMAGASSFRFEGSGQQIEEGGQALAQRVEAVFQAPDRLHVKLLSLDGSLQVQLWVTGAKSYVQEPPQPDGTASPVRCAPAEQTPTSDPRRLLQAVAKATNVKASGSSVSFELPPEAAATAFGPPTGGAYEEIKGTAALVEGRIGTLHVEAKNGKRKLVADFVYSDIGSAPAVTPPEASC